MKKNSIIALTAAAVLAVGMISGCGAEKTSNSSDAAVTQEKVTPTFMYFVSNSDPDFEQTNEMIKELETEYSKKIKFDVINIDENTEAAQNFPVQGNTPALIMLNTSNDISAMEFKCSDKDKLTADIEAALK